MFSYPFLPKYQDSKPNAQSLAFYYARILDKNWNRHINQEYNTVIVTVYLFGLLWSTNLKDQNSFGNLNAKPTIYSHYKSVLSLHFKQQMYTKCNRVFQPLNLVCEFVCNMHGSTTDLQLNMVGKHDRFIAEIFLACHRYRTFPKPKITIQHQT